MTKEIETISNIYEALQVEKQKKAKPNPHHKWLLTTGTIVLGVVCFVAGFLMGYLTVPSKGKNHCRRI